MQRNQSYKKGAEKDGNPIPFCNQNWEMKETVR